MSKLSNTLLMLSFLKSGRKYQISELASLLEVSNRMIRIYKEDLEKSGIYIDTIKGPYGGYMLRNTNYLPTPLFSKEDIERIEALDIKKKLTDILTKMKCLTPERKMLNTKDVIFKTISRAIKEKRKVKMIYYTEGKGKRERTIHPYHIIYYGTSFGCAAYCETKKDLRHFAFDRIEQIELLSDFYD